MCGAHIWIYESVGRAILGWRRKLYSFSEVTSIRFVVLHRDKKLRTSGRNVWTTYVALISTYVDIWICVPGL